MAPNKGISEDFPPSSYPGIWKYPSGRETPFRSGFDWMDSKRKDDDIGPSLWRVHDKLYDLSTFLDSHPGGKVWLELTKGTDITEAFETAHIVNPGIVEKRLASFYVGEAKHPRISPYTFKDNGFFKTLKRRVEPVMKKVGSGPTQGIKNKMDFMASVFLTTLILGTYLDSYFLLSISGFFLAISLIAAHNFFHLRACWRTYLFDIGLLSSHEWRITHALSHHLFPNTVMDIELELFPTYQFLPNRPKNFVQKYGAPVYSHFLYMIGFWIDWGRRTFAQIVGKQKFRMENLILYFELVVCMFLASNAEKGFLSWIFVHTVSSFVFLTQGANAAHHHPDEFHDGDEARPDPDFGLCQLDATRDKAEDIYQNEWIVLITFSHHQLHHLFPTICHSKLPHIQKAFEETLKEFKENFPPIPQLDLYLGTFKQLARTETKRRKDK